MRGAIVGVAAVLMFAAAYEVQAQQVATQQSDEVSKRGRLAALDKEITERQAAASEFLRQASAAIHAYGYRLRSEQLAGMEAAANSLMSISADLLFVALSPNKTRASAKLLDDALDLMRSGVTVYRAEEYLSNLETTTAAFQRSYDAEISAIDSLQAELDQLIIGTNVAGDRASSSLVASDSSSSTDQSHSRPCLNWSETAQLVGIVSNRTFPGRPNFESIEDGDEAVTLPIMTLDEVICIDQGRGEQEPSLGGIKEIQITAAYPAEGPATLRGKLFYGVTAHHRTQVLLDAEAPSCLSWGQEVTLTGTVAVAPVDDHQGGTVDVKFLNFPSVCVSESPDEGYPEMRELTEVQIFGEGLDQLAAGSATLTGELQYDVGDAYVEAVLQIGDVPSRQTVSNAVKGAWSHDANGKVPSVSYQLAGHPKVQSMTIFCTGSDSLGLRVSGKNASPLSTLWVTLPDGGGMLWRFDRDDRVLQEDYVTLVRVYGETLSQNDEANGGQFGVEISEGADGTGLWYDLSGMREARETLRAKCAEVGDWSPTERVAEWPAVQEIMNGLISSGACAGTVMNIMDGQISCSVAGRGGFGIMFRIRAANASTSQRADRRVFVMGSVEVTIPQSIFARQSPDAIGQHINTVFGPLGLSTYTQNLLGDLERGQSGFNRNAGPGIMKEVMFVNDTYGIYGQDFKYTLVWNCNGGPRQYRVCQPY